MASPSIIRLDKLEPAPWKNGGGVTRELARGHAPNEPDSGSAFSWRLSIADIERAGPFSAFDGYCRTLVLLQGTGLRLDFQDGLDARLDRIANMVEFDGGEAVSASLGAGPCRVINVMTARQARCGWTVRLLRDTSLEIAGAFVLLPALGEWRLSGGGVPALTPGVAALRLNAGKPDAADACVPADTTRGTTAGEKPRTTGGPPDPPPTVSCRGAGFAILLQFHSDMPVTPCAIQATPRSHP
jgi:environmental stress-induced protein Ves